MASKRTAATVRAAEIKEICGVCTNFTDSQSSLLAANFVLNSTSKVNNVAFDAHNASITLFLI